MIDRAVVQHHLRRLARAAPGAFRADPLFRYTALGAAGALLASLANLAHPGGGGVPAPPPPPATLGASYSDRSTPASTTPAPAPAGPLRPSRSLSGMTVHADPRAPADRFGTLRAAQPRKETP